MNPYEAPKQASEPKSESAEIEMAAIPGRPCDFCGSRNTGEDRLSPVAPNFVFVLFFGWTFLLIRAAFSTKNDLCRDCGQVNTYKTTGSKIALIVLIGMIILAISIAMKEP